jgi:hypothetical protein
MPNKIRLLATTENAQVDDILCGVISILEAMFPQRIRGYYLVGSYEDGTFVHASDIDMVPIFKGSTTDAEEAAFWQVLHDLNLISPIRLGFGLRNEEKSFIEGGVGIKIGSKLLYGEDVRDKIPLWSFDVYMQYMIGAHIASMLDLRKAESLNVPLTYPDPNAAFYGYLPTDADSTGGLFGHVMVMASTLVTLRTGAYNASKSRSYAFYAQHIGDAWSAFLEAIYAQFKKTWQYQIPEAAEDRQAMHALCGQILGFEKHFLEEAISYLRKQQAQGKAWAAEQLAKLNIQPPTRDQA